jgi:carbamoyl-phosphate synthase large subunit
MKKLLILGAGIIQIPVILKAKELNIYSIVLDYDEKAPGINYADAFYGISTNDTEKVLTLAKKLNITGILTTSDYPVNTVAKVAQELSLPGMSIELANLCTNKYLQRQFFRNNDVRVPKYVFIKSVDDLFCIDFFPCIIKPVDSSASRGVKLVHNQKEIVDQYPISKNYSKSNGVIVEEFIHGREFSVETITQHGNTHIVQITEKLTIGEEFGYFVEDTHIMPARITLLEKENI